MTHLITKTLLALACAGTFAAPAGAQLPTAYTQGDLLVGLHQVGNANSVVVDLGQISDFSVPNTFAIDLGATLSDQYGTGWATDPSVFFSLAEASGGNTNYMTSPGYLAGPNAGPAKVWTRQTNTNASILRGKINNLGGEFTSAGRVQPKTDSNAYANYMPGGKTDAAHAASGNIAWGFFNPTSEGNFGQGTTGVELDMVQLVPGSGPGTDLGYFQLSGNGNTLTYSPGAIPEPSTFAAIVLGALTLAASRLHGTRRLPAKE